jgi:hypothetical protein
VNAYNNRQSTCRDNQCMKQITVNQVFNEVCRLYRQSIRDKSGGINLTGLAGSGRPDAGVNRCNASS